jgi:pimeloyl-ACP methyl ester carboxylesterase
MQSENMNPVNQPRDNLHTLHAEEERLRDASLTLIGGREDLREHLAIVHEAMNAIFAFTQEHVQGSDDELTLQLLGIRLFNAAAASIKLALSGYYQKAFVHMRDIGHFPMSENPEKFRRYLLPILREVQRLTT